MSVEKRKALYEIARDNGIFIIEDNPYGELTFDGVKLPTIKSMDSEGVVLYSGSFSKILAPGLRLGYLIAPKNFTEKAVLGKQVSDVHTPCLPQLLALEFMNRYDIVELIAKTEEFTKNNTGIVMNIALNYGAREEITTAVKNIAASVADGAVDVSDIDSEYISSMLYTAGQPDPDLLIRTSGEIRLSNFMLWQLAYSEMYFTDKLWPDFTVRDLEDAICEYQRRNRRFGGV